MVSNKQQRSSEKWEANFSTEVEAPKFGVLLLPAASSSSRAGVLCVWQHPPAPALPRQAELSQGNEAVTAGKASDCSCWHPGGAPCSPASHHTTVGWAFFLALRVFSTEKNVSTYFSPSSLWNMRHTLVMLKGVDLWLTLSLISPQSSLELLSRWDSITSFII